MSKAELAGFLRDRRARLRPASTGERRRTPGLRRDEVAQRATMSVDYYTRLEQARGAQPSPRILESLSAALDLDRADRDRLFALAGTSPVAPRTVPRTVRRHVVELLHRMPATAGIVTAATYDVIACNPLAAALLGHLDDEPNLARRYFLQGRHWSSGADGFAEVAVARLRAAATRYPSDRGLAGLLQELRAGSAPFRELWATDPTRSPATAPRPSTTPSPAGCASPATSCWCPRTTSRSCSSPRNPAAATSGRCARSSPRPRRPDRCLPLSSPAMRSTGRGGRPYAAAVPDLPPLPAGLAARPLDPLDIDAVVGLLAAAEPVDRTGEHWDAEDLEGEWVNELVDLRADGLLVVADGAAVGWATAIAPPTFRDAFTVYLEGRVHPGWRGRGVGRALLGWQLARGAEVHAARHPEAPGRLTVPVPATMGPLERLVRRAGLAPTRVFLTMERPLTGLPALPAPPGVELVPYDWARDDEVRRAHNAAFVAHHGSSERDRASWEVMFTGRTAFRPDLSTLVLQDGAVVAYALAYVYESDTRATGRRSAYLGQIGTLPGYRGRGLAGAATAASLRAAAARGCDLASLEVDSENGTGAVGLYERLGFAEARRTTSWTRALPPR